MAQGYFKYSTTNLPAGTRIDIDALTLKARRHPVALPVPQATQATTTEEIFPLTQQCKVVAISLVYPGTVPAVSGGTATIAVDHIAADGSTAVVVVTAVTILSGFTTQIPVALTLAATNPTSMAAGGSLLVSVVTSNNSVGAAGVAGKLAILLEPVEDAALSE